MANCTKDQLLNIAEHYEIAVHKQGHKEAIWATLKDQLVQLAVLPDLSGSKSEAVTTEEGVVGPPVLTISISTFLTNFRELTFEQKKNFLLYYQQENEHKERAYANLERARLQQQELEIERLKGTTKLLEAEMQHECYTLDLIKKGKLSTISLDVATYHNEHLVKT